MSTKVRDFIDFWIENSVHAGEQYGAQGGSQIARDLADRCVEMADAQGISKDEIEKEIGDIPAFIKNKLGSANLKEDERQDRHRN